MIRILILFVLLFSQDFRYNKQGKPSTKGIEMYINNNSDLLIQEFNYKIQDSLLIDPYIYVEDLSDFYDYDTLELGRFYIPDNIILTNEEKYIAYELNELSKFKKWLMYKHDRTVKEVLFHELAHVYTYQIIMERDIDTMIVAYDYKTAISIIPRTRNVYGTDFIEEGIAQYIVNRIGDSPELKNVEIPKLKQDLFDNKNDVQYHYSIYFLKEFLDQYKIREGIEILIANDPPSYEEILNKELFFNRLIIND